MPHKVGRGTYAGYRQPSAGERSEREQHVLRKVYGLCRKNQYPGEDPEAKERCAKIAWGAVHKLK